ncbi:MAG: ABC transporter substrate-binding protein [bacterium]
MDSKIARIRAFVDRGRQRIKTLLAARAARSNISLDRRLVLKLSGKRLPSAGQIKHLPRFLSPKEKTAVGVLTMIIVLAVGTIGIRFVASHIKDAPADGGQYIEASVGGPRFVNPILAFSNDVDLDITKLVFSGLIKTDNRGTLVPDLAESFAVDEDGKTYTFVLREGVTWHDGAPFSASDVAATFGFIKDPSFKSPLFSQFRNVEVETPDERTVVFRLKEPFAPFLSLLTVGIMPIHLWQEVIPENASRAELNVKPIGTGPFRFKSFTKDKKGAIRSYTLSRNNEFYGQQPHLSEMTFVFYPDFDQAAEELLQRRVDGLSFLPLEYRESADRISSIRTYTFQLPQYTAIFFNQDRNQALKSKAVRQALAMAIDKDTVLSETLGYDGIPVHGPILPGFVGFYPEIKRYRQDLEAAGKLLDNEGWTKGDDGIRSKKLAGADGEKVDTPLSITLTTVDAKENITVAQTIQRMWEALGIRVETELVPSSRIQQDKLRPRDYGALLYGEILGPDPDPYPFWHSSQSENGGLNLSKFSNRRADELLEQARSTNDAEKRTALYQKFQDILADEIPAIFLYSPNYTYAVDKRVKGIETTTIFTPADRFTDLANWYVKTKKVWE